MDLIGADTDGMALSQCVCRGSCRGRSLGAGSWSWTIHDALAAGALIARRSAECVKDESVGMQCDVVCGFIVRDTIRPFPGLSCSHNAELWRGALAALSRSVLFGFWIVWFYVDYNIFYSCHLIHH